MAAITPSATTTVNSASVSGAVAVSASSTVNLALASNAGVRSVSYTIVGNHSSSASNPTITAGADHAASFTMPAGIDQAYLIETVVNNGLDTSGRAVAGYKFRFIVGVAGLSGLVPGALGEKTERGTYGHLPLINQALTGSTPGAPQTITISGGTATLGTRSGQAYEIHPQSGTSDVLETISGGSEGERITIKPDNGDTIVVLDNSDGNGDNIKLKRGENLVLRDGEDRLYLEYDGTYWNEISRTLAGRFSSISSLATAANANYDFSLDTDGIYSIGIRIVIETTSYDRVWIGSVIAKKESSAVTLIGSATASSIGDSTNITVTVSGNSSNLRVNVANATGETANGHVEIVDDEVTRLVS